jgi:hypothetical protein
MNDPHVEWLRYRLELGATLAVNDPPPLDLETDHFTLRLEAGKLTVSMKEHHSSIESTQERVAPFLRSWERDNDLTHGLRALRFVYEDCQIIDRNPPPPGSAHTILAVGVASLAMLGSAVRLVIGLREYPPPPPSFKTTPDVEALFYHYESYLDGKERLSDMGHFCLTLVRGLGGGNDGAADMFQISAPVLRKLGELTTDRGDEKTARKYMLQPRPYRPQEETWIKDVVRALIRRVGEHAAGGPLKKLTMADFHPLP